MWRPEGRTAILELALERVQVKPPLAVPGCEHRAPVQGCELEFVCLSVPEPCTFLLGPCSHTRSHWHTMLCRASASGDRGTPSPPGSPVPRTITGENFGMTSEAGDIAPWSRMFSSSVLLVLVLQNQLPCAVFEVQNPYKCSSGESPFSWHWLALFESLWPQEQLVAAQIFMSITFRV